MCIRSPSYVSIHVLLQSACFPVLPRGAEITGLPVSVKILVVSTGCLDGKMSCCPDVKMQACSGMGDKARSGRREGGSSALPFLSSHVCAMLECSQFGVRVCLQGPAPCVIYAICSQHICSFWILLPKMLLQKVDQVPHAEHQILLEYLLEIQVSVYVWKEDR